MRVMPWSRPMVLVRPPEAKTPSAFAPDSMNRNCEWKTAPSRLGSAGTGTLMTAEPLAVAWVTPPKVVKMLLRMKQPGAPRGVMSKGSGMPPQDVALVPIVRMAGSPPATTYELPVKTNGVLPGDQIVAVCEAVFVPLADRQPAPFW